MEKKVIEIEVKDNTKSLKQQYREAVIEVQRLADAFGATSVEVQKASKRAAELKDQIEDVNDAIQAQKGEGTFIALGKSISAVASGFSAVEGAMGLVGAESEDLQKALLRVQSAMALAQGLEGLEDIGRSFSQLKTVISTTATTAINGFKAMTTASKVFMVTGIGLIITGLGTVVTYWDDIKKAVSGVSEEQEKLNELSHQNFETAKQSLETLSAQDNILKLQGKSEREILKIKIEKVKSAIDLGKIELENVIKTSKAEEESAIKNYNLTKKVVDFILDTAFLLPKLMLMPIDMAIKGANKVSEVLGLGKAISFDLGQTLKEMQSQASSFIAGSIFNVQEVKAEGEATRKEIEKQLLDLENQKAGFELSIKDIDKKSLEDKKKNAQEKYQIDDTELKRREAQRQMDLENLQQFIYSTENLEIKSAKDAIDRLSKQRQTELEIEKESNERKREMDKETLENYQRLQQTRLQLTSNAFSAIGQLIESFQAKDEATARKQFQIAKAFNLASAVSNTALAVTSALALRPDQSVFPGQRFVEAGIAATTGLANVVKIASTQFGGNNTGGGFSDTSRGGGGVIAPNLNVVGDTGINQLASLQQQPIKAYVVSGDITSQQMFDLKVQQTASL